MCGTLASVRITYASARRSLAVHDSLSGTDRSCSSAEGPSVGVAVAVLVLVPVAVAGVMTVGDAGGGVDDAVANGDAVAVCARGGVRVGCTAVAVAVETTTGVAVAER